MKTKAKTSERLMYVEISDGDVCLVSLDNGEISYDPQDIKGIPFYFLGEKEEKAVWESMGSTVGDGWPGWEFVVGYLNELFPADLGPPQLPRWEGMICFGEDVDEPTRTVLFHAQDEKTAFRMLDEPHDSLRPAIEAVMRQAGRDPKVAWHDYQAIIVKPAPAVAAKDATPTQTAWPKVVTVENDDMETVGCYVVNDDAEMRRAVLAALGGETMSEEQWANLTGYKGQHSVQSSSGLFVSLLQPDAVPAAS